MTSRTPRATSRKTVALAAAAMLVALAAPFASAKPPAGNPSEGKAKTTEVQILALNDFHGQLRPPDSTSSGGRIGATPAGGAEYLASYVRDLRATNPNTLFVSAGDLIGATPLVSAIFHDEPSIEVMNLMGLDYNGVGNHEFDEGAAELTRMQVGGCHPIEGCFGGDGFEGADFEFLAANVTYESTGDTIFPAFAIHEFPGVDVAIVGMTLEGTPSIVTAAATADIDFHDEADSVNALVPILKEAGVETVIVLLHEGGSVLAPGLNETTINQCNVRTDMSTAIIDVVTRFNPEIDLVVTGHTNWGINCPDFMGTGIMLTGGGSVGRLVTDIDLTLSRASKDVVGASINNVIVRRDVKPAAADVTALITKYGDIAAPTENRVIGDAPTALLRDNNAFGESSLGDIIADAQLWATSGAGWSHGAPAQLTFMNAGGIRAIINAGPITYGEAFNVQPFANVLVTMDMTGAQIDAVLEQQFTGGNEILQIPHTLNWQRSAVAGDRAQNITIGGVPLDPTATYRVTLNNFLADGGDNYTVFKQGTNRYVGEIDLDGFARYVEMLGTVNPGPQNRISAAP